MSALAGCRSAQPMPRVDLAQGSWGVHSGQAVWRPARERPAMAGELTVATRPDGAFWVQFAKEPFPLVTGQANGTRWWLSFPTAKRTLTGRMDRAERWVWLQLPGLLFGQPVAARWRLECASPGRFRLQNPDTGEVLEGYLAP